MSESRKPKKKEEHALREWVSDNLRYIILIAVIAVAAVAVFLAIRAFAGKAQESESAVSSAETRVITEKSSPDTEDASAAVSPVPTKPAATPTAAPKPESTPSATPTPAVTAAPEEPQVPDAQTAVTDVVARYFQGLSAGDPAAVEAVTETLDQADREAIAAKSFAENYDSFRFLVYPGDAEGTYVVFAAYEYQYPGFATRLPALTELYVFTRPDGSMCIASEATENEKAAVLQQALEKEEIQALLAETRQKYEEALLSDPALSAYIQSQFEG